MILSDRLIRNLLIWLVVLIPLLLLALLNRVFLLNAVIIPIEYQAWLAGLAVKATPQYVFWGLLCAIVLVIAGHSLLSGVHDSPQPRRELPGRTSRERVAFWVLQLHLARHGDYSRLRFTEFFGKLILDILAYTGQVDQEQITQAINTASIELPSTVQGFLKSRLATFAELKGVGFFRRIFLRIVEFFSRKPPEDEESSFDRDVRETVVYLEHELEVDSHHYGNQ